MSLYFDRLKAAVLGMVKTALARVDYYALYPSRVVGQDGADFSLELIPDDTKVPGLSGVPIRLGLPNATVKVANGSRVLLGFEGGDPSRPVATLWDTSSCTELRLNGTTIVLNGGTAKVARVGDSISATIPAGTVKDHTGVTNATDIPLSGTITSGANGVKA